MSIKIFDLMEYFEIDYYRADNLLVGACPIHEGDNLTAFNINIDLEDKHCGKWFCNTHNCHEEGYGNDIISFFWIMYNKKTGKENPFPRFLGFCEKFCKDVDVDADELVSTYHGSTIDKLHKPARKPVKQSSGITRSRVRQFLQFPAKFYLDRGFTAEALDHFDVGLCIDPRSQMKNRVVFPVFDDNDEFLVGAVGRTVVDDPRKWINQKGFNKSNHLFNYGKALKYAKTCNSLILVEGQGDVIRLFEAGIRNVVGLFGSKFSDAQEFMVQRTGVESIVIMTDNDTAGVKVANEMQERLRYVFNTKIVLPQNDDVGDMSISEINEQIKPQIQRMYA